MYKYKILEKCDTIECRSENNLFYHVMKEKYENFDQYNVYNPISYPGWSAPFTRELIQGKTHLIYNGVPVGKYQKYIIELLYQSLDSVLSERKD